LKGEITKIEKLNQNIYIQYKTWKPESIISEK